MDKLKQLEIYLENEQVQDAQDLYNQHDFEVIKQNDYWDLSSLFCTYLNRQTNVKLCDELNLFCMKSIFNLIETYGKPKELLLIYLESAEIFFINDEKYLKFTQILTIILNRLVVELKNKKNFYYSFELVSKNLLKYLKVKIELPLKINLNDKKEKLLFDNDVRVERCVELASAYLNFIHEFSPHLVDITDKMAVCCVLLDLLSEPLINLNLEYYDDLKLNENSVKLCEKLFQLIVYLSETRNLFSFIDYCILKSNGTDYTVSIGVLIYLAYTKNFGFQTNIIPQMYTSLYIFEKFQPFIYSLLQLKNQFSIDKGIKLADHLFSSIEELHDNYFDNQIFADFIDTLINRLIYCDLEQSRRDLLKLFNKIFKCFKRYGRFKFLYIYLNKNQQDNTLNNYLSAHLVYLFKEEINECLNTADTFYELESNLNFKKIFNLLFKLSHSVETDLMDESSRIISVLNLLRFLLLKDKLNRTQVYTLIKQNVYLEELGKALDLSKAHYKLEINKLKQNDPEISVSKKVDLQIDMLQNDGMVDFNQMPNVDEQIYALNNALRTFDLIESIRARVNELLYDETYLSAIDRSFQTMMS